MPRAYTKQEELDAFMNAVRGIAAYWAKVENHTVQQQCDGVAFSILSMLDGSNISRPAMELALAPHPEDKQYNIDNGDNWHEPGLVINDDCALHELFYKRKEG